MKWYGINIIDLETGDCVDGMETESHSAEGAIAQAREVFPQYDNDRYEFETY